MFFSTSPFPLSSLPQEGTLTEFPLGLTSGDTSQSTGNKSPLVTKTALQPMAQEPSSILGRIRPLLKGLESVTAGGRGRQEEGRWVTFPAGRDQAQVTWLK